MRRVSMGLTMAVLTGAAGCHALPRGGDGAAAPDVVARRPDSSGAGVDPMPVGTAREVARLRRVRTTRKTGLPGRRAGAARPSRA